MPSIDGIARNATILVASAILLTGCDGRVGPATDEDFCKESAEAAHYIAAKSGTPRNVVRVVNDVVADRKYPLIGDKVVASIGSVVALSLGRETPDEISEKIRKACTKGK